MLEAVALVTDLLLLAVPLDRLRVPLPILRLVVGVRIAPLFPAVLHPLGVEGIGANLFAVIIPAALPLARGLAANQLLRVIRCRLKDLLTVRATTIIHQAAPDQNASGSFCPEPLSNSNPPPKKITAYRNSYRVFYRVPAHGAAAHQTGRTAALLHRRGQYSDGALFPFDCGSSSSQRSRIPDNRDQLMMTKDRLCVSIRNGFRDGFILP